GARHRARTADHAQAHRGARRPPARALGAGPAHDVRDPAAAAGGAAMSGRTLAIVAGALLVAGVALRAWDLSLPLLWVDEAESSINALTILEHGVPTDRYLGLPIFENTLTDPWPESAEYEFHDSSYSREGYAVYHGWLPLYAIAAAFRVAGIRPDPQV